jgi:hypothetical protein
MTDATLTPFTLVGAPDAAVCDGDFCVIPDHNEQKVVNRKLDDDAV